MVHREVREKVSKKETAIYHFDVYLNNYFTLVQEEKKKHLKRSHYSARKEKKTFRSHYSPNILTNKIIKSHQYFFLIYGT